MHVMHREVARERARDALEAAADQRLARQARAVQRWHKVAERAERRLVRARRELSDAQHAESQ